MHGRNAVSHDAAADQEHGDRAGDAQSLHQPWRCAQDAASDGAQQRTHAAALQLAQVQAQVVQLHDGGHNAIDAHGHGQGDDGHDGDLRG